MYLSLLILLLLILLNGFLNLAEFATVSARPARLRQMVEQGERRAELVLELVADRTRFLSTVQVGITLISILTGVFGGAALAEHAADPLRAIPTLAPYADAIGFGIIVVGTTFLTLILGELVPKRIALAHPERLAIMTAGWMRALSRGAAPIAWFLSRITDLVLRLIPMRKDAAGAVTDAEIKYLMREGTRSGHFEQAESDIVEMALRLGDRRVSALMRPRTHMEYLDLDDAPGENQRKIVESHVSRFPVIQGGFERVLGIVQAKDLLAPLLRNQPFDLRAAIKPPVFIPETAPALKALELFKRTGNPIALIVDEYGDLQGLVTLTDLMESLVGDIAAPGQADDPASVKRADGSWLIDGMMPIDEVADLVGLPRRPEEDATYTTLGGFMMAQLKRIPAPADAVTLDGFKFEVMDMDGRRVDKVLVVPPAPAPVK
ncbi:MAG: HlyC/CorC family transporter [Proteobacteria bacterium]|nr:HlyC/CorC family transporter [Pseudomonadota bacterium]